MSDLPQDKETLSKWLKQKWDEKEKLLREYYAKPEAKRSFVSDPLTSPLAIQLATANGAYQRKQIIHGLGWFAVLVFIFYSFFTIWWSKWYLIVGIICWVIITRMGGADNLERKLHLK